MRAAHEGLAEKRDGEVAVLAPDLAAIGGFRLPEKMRIVSQACHAQPEFESGEQQRRDHDREDGEE